MQIDTQKVRDVSEGIIQNVDVSITPPNSVSFSVNLLYDVIIGRGVIRPGLTITGSQITDNKSCNGLYLFIKTDDTKVLLSVFNNAGDTLGEVRSFDGSVWGASDTTITQGVKAHFVTFLDTVAVLYGGAPKASTDGINWVTTATSLDVGNMPQGKYGVEFKDKIYISGVAAEPDRLYYSSVPTAGAISWTAGNGFIDIEPEEGTGGIIGLSKVPGYLLIFKKRSMKRWDGSSTYPESLMNQGAFSQDAIVMGRQSVFFMNAKGIFETTGGFPRKISRRIQKIIELISTTYYESVTGWSDGDRVFFSIGDLSFDGRTYPSCVIVYNIDSQNFSLLSFNTQLRMWGDYIDSNDKEYVVAGDTDGQVHKVLSGIGDNGTDISWMIQWQPQEFGDRGRLKTVSRYVTYVQDIRNATLLCKTDLIKDFKSLGTGITVNKDVQEHKQTITGRQFDFRLSGASRSGQVIGIDFPSVDVKLNYDQ